MIYYYGGLWYTLYFPLLFLGSLKGLWGQFCEPKLPPIDPTMEVSFAKHDLRNVPAFVEDGIGANRLELHCKMHHQNGHILYSL